VSNISTDCVTDVVLEYGNKYALSDTEIKKIVENTQRIEGYESTSPEVKARVRALMKKHNVKVSF